MHKLIQDLKDYGGTIIVILLAILTAAISYGGSTAVAAVTLANHETRLTAVESELKTQGQALAAMKQHVDDLWHDNGHRDNK